MSFRTSVEEENALFSKKYSFVIVTVCSCDEHGCPLFEKSNRLNNEIYDLILSQGYLLAKGGQKFILTF